MPNTKSAEKTVRKDARRRARNRAAKSAIKSAMKRLRGLVAEGNLAQAELFYRDVAKRLDQTAAKRVIHGNKAARHKSRLTALLRRHAAGASAAPAPAAE
jgi:small subunit ribosomal protein S20